jgi:exopolysaccharide biosynthesis polyprenyl glycosylphosphotransferase
MALTQAIFVAMPARWPSIAGALLVALVLALALRVVASASARRKLVERVLVLGGGPLADHLVEAIESRPRRRQRVLGIVDDRTGVDSATPRLGALRDFERIVERVRPDRLIVALASRRGQMPFKTLLSLRVGGMAVEDGIDYYERLTGKVPIEALTPTSFIFSKDSRSRGMDQAMAWALSLPFAVAALILLVPLFALVALAIKLDSAGPVFFVQPRAGRGGRPFRLIKFRTMRPATGTTSEWVRDNHGRLTRVGRWLRRFRLDELPQFVNVVMGDMNVVGPRPHPVTNLPLLVLVARNTPECGEQIPFYALRSLVRPGLTGWAQVRYQYANDLEEEIEKMRYDLYYIKHRSLWLDLRIVLETLKIVIHGPESDGQVEPPGKPAGAEGPGLAPLRLADATDPLVAPRLPIGAMPVARTDGRTAARA